MAGRVLESNDNGDGPTEEVFTRILNEHIRLEKEASSVRSKQKALKKKAEDDGIDMTDLKAALKLVSADPREVIAQRNRELQYARWLKAPVGEQLHMLEMPPDQSKMSDEQREQKWEDEGWQAGLMGRDRDTCPHAPESLGFQAWMRGYDAGQRKNLSGIKGPNNKPVTDPSNAPKLDGTGTDAAPKRRGRPPKNQTAASSSEGEKGAAPPAPPSSGDGGKKQPPAPPAPPKAAKPDEPKSEPMPEPMPDADLSEEERKRIQDDLDWQSSGPGVS
jgi:ribosome modulation factor